MVWSRPSLTGTTPPSRHGHMGLTIEDDEVVTFGGMSRQGYEQVLHVLQVGVGNHEHYPSLAA